MCHLAGIDARNPFAMPISSSQLMSGEVSTARLVVLQRLGLAVVAVGALPMEVVGEVGETGVWRRAHSTSWERNWESGGASGERDGQQRAEADESSGVMARYEYTCEAAKTKGTASWDVTPSRELRPGGLDIVTRIVTRGAETRSGSTDTQAHALRELLQADTEGWGASDGGASNSGVRGPDLGPRERQ